MSVVWTDAKKRISLPGSRPGEAYEVINGGPVHYSLIRLVAPPKTKTRALSEVKKAMKRAPLKPAMIWDHLRKLTREP